MLSPLKEFRCDHCTDTINDPSQGWVEWLDLDGKCSQFRIVHRREHSQALNGCCGAEGRKDWPFYFIDDVRELYGEYWLATAGKHLTEGAVPGGEYPAVGHEKLGTENMKYWRAYPLEDYLGFKSMAFLRRILKSGAYCPGSHTKPEGLDLQDLTHFICRLTIPYYEDIHLRVSRLVFRVGLLPLLVKTLVWGDEGRVIRMQQVPAILKRLFWREDEKEI
jgi:hypothetical protein